MPEDLESPPQTPPGEPGGEGSTTAEGNTPPDQPKPGGPVFTPEQTSRMIGDAVEGAFKKVFPSKPADTSFESPTGPSPQELESEIDKLDNQIDLAVQEGKSVRELNKRRDQLRDQKFDIERVQPLRSQGSSGINELVINNLKLSDPLFEQYEQEFMDLIRPSMKAGQVLTLKVAQEGFALIKGRHIKEIIAQERETEARQKKLDSDANLPGGTSGRQVSSAPKSPDTIRERFGDRAEEAFRSKANKGMDAETFARKLGYKDKADWFKQDDELSRDVNGTFDLDNSDQYWKEVKRKRELQERANG